MKKQCDPWLFRRMVRFGLLAPTMPIYVCSEQVSDQIAILNRDAPQERLAEIAVFPHDEFAIEMTCRTDDPENWDQRFRTLTIISPTPAGATDVPYFIWEVQAYNGNNVILPPHYCGGPGLAIQYQDREAFRACVRRYWGKLRELGERNDPKGTMKVKGWPEDAFTMEQFNKSMAQATAFLTTACAVIASPAVSRSSGTSPARAPGPRRGEERRVETRWTQVDLVIDRDITNVATAAMDGSGRTGVALHPVRSHLRVTRHGISKVRAHMRGDAKYGTRHRVGHVHTKQET